MYCTHCLQYESNVDLNQINKQWWKQKWIWYDLYIEGKLILTSTVCTSRRRRWKQRPAPPLPLLARKHGEDWGLGLGNPPPSRPLSAVRALGCSVAYVPKNSIILETSHAKVQWIPKNLHIGNLNMGPLTTFTHAGSLRNETPGKLWQYESRLLHKTVNKISRAAHRYHHWPEISLAKLYRSTQAFTSETSRSQKINRTRMLCRLTQNNNITIYSYNA